MFFRSFRLCCCVVAVAFVAFALAPAAKATQALPSEAALATELRLADATAWAVARSPALSELRQLQSASQFDSQAAQHLPDPQLKYEQWSVPLRRPWALDHAGAVMVGLQQVIPPAGTRGARSQAEAAQVQALRSDEQVRRLQVVAQVHKAFAAYYQAHWQLVLHQQHSALVEKLLALARVAYQSGVRTQQDVVRLGLEFSRVHETLVRLQPELGSAKALMNTLMNRPVDAPLGPPAQLDPSPFAANFVAPDNVDANRPEVKVAQANVLRSQAMLNVAAHSAKRPMVMVGVDYMFMPNDMYQHTYGAMVAVGLPWLNPGRSEEERAARHRLAANKDALESVRLMARYELRDAQMRMQAARASYDVLQRDVVLQAQRNLDTARSMYSAGQSDASALMDAARLFLEVQMDKVRSLALLQEAAADLSRALTVDTDLDSQERKR